MSYRQNIIIIFLTTIILGGFGCKSSPPIKSLTVRTCEEKGGPPSSDLVRCRMLQASDKGKLPRHITPEEADRLIIENSKLGKAIQSRQERKITQEQLDSQVNAWNSLCLELTGLTCEKLYFSPMDVDTTHSFTTGTPKVTTSSDQLIELKIDWPASTTIDSKAYNYLDKENSVAASSSSVPVLLPNNRDILTNGKIKIMDDGYTFASDYQNLHVYIEGTRFAYELQGTPSSSAWWSIKPNAKVRGKDAYLQGMVEGSAQEIDWKEFGAAYSVFLDCGTRSIDTCVKQVREIAETMVLIGGSKLK